MEPSSNGYPEQVSASGLPVPDEAAVQSSGSPTGKSLRLRKRTRRDKPNQRVTWDEKAIAEHDKERGTRQKIDEPDTPFIRSPQTASDSEGEKGGGPLSSDDEQRRLSIRSPIHIPGLEAGKQNPSAMPTRSPADDLVNVGAIADRLNDWVLNGELQRDRKRSDHASSRGDVSSSGDEEAQKSRMSHSGSCDGDPKVRRRNSGDERRISLSEDSPMPRPSSDNFKAKRANHYNEVAAMKAFKQKGAPVVSDSESDTSDEDKQDGTILTNTNTNKNMNPGRNRGRLDSESGPSSTGGSFSAASDAAAAPEATRGQEALAGGQAAASSAAPACAESTESPGDGAGAALADSLRGPGVAFGRAGPDRPEEGQKKKSGAEEAAWKAKRNAHYNEMAMALRRQPPPSDEESDSSSAED